MKAYLKEGRARRVETTINNASDFGVPKTLNAENWRAMRKVGAATNARFLAALGEGRPGLPDPATLESVVLPTSHDGQRGPGPALRRAPDHGLLASVAAFSHVVGGLTNRTLRQQMAVLWSPDYSQSQASYDLRRLRLKGFIERVTRTNTCRVTAHGRRMATFFTKLANRVVVPGLTQLASLVRPPRGNTPGRPGCMASLRAHRRRPRPKASRRLNPALKLASNVQD